MSDIRWSARADATKALFMGYDEINAALEKIAGDDEEKAETREEACGLAAYMNRLESGILFILWHHILHRFHANSQVLQSADQDLNSAVQIYESLIEFIHKLRERFEEFERKGKSLSECEHYVSEARRVRTRNRRYDEPGSEPEVTQTPASTFRTGTLLVIIYNLDAELRKRLDAYATVAARFGFLRKLKELSSEEVVENAKRFQEAYSNDIEASLSEEMLQFSAFLNTDFVKKTLQVTATSHPDRPSVLSSRVSDDKTVEQDDDDVEMDVESLELRMYRLLVTKNLETVFPNTIIMLHMYLSLMISNCSGERTFSKLKLIKSQL